MKFITALVGVLATTANAHSDGHVPKLVGGRKLMAEMRARGALPEPLEAPAPKQRQSLEARQSNTGRCGQGLGTCASNCCSAEGYCGTGTDYCAAPDCQYQYGPGCDANKVPAGASTAGIARPKVGNVLYGGAGIYDCVVPGQIAFTFDDGPYIYTSSLLDKLKAYNAKATFFITGNNLGKGPIDSTPQWSNMIKRMVAEGHQIASHTWSHQSLTSVDAATFDKQMIYNEMAFRNILGYFPTYMRPPYSQCDGACGTRLANLGYHVTYFDLDTEGYLNTLPTQIQKSKNIWDNAIKNAKPATDNYLQIEHDIHDQVVNNLTDYVLASMYQKGFKSVTVGQCLGDPIANWYRSAGGSTPPPNPSSSSSTPTPTPGGGQTVSVDGDCSSTVTCQGSTFGNCCSQYGFCGSTAAYCGAGCQKIAGTCSDSTPASSSSKPLTSSTKTTTKTSSTKTTSKSSSTSKPASTGPAKPISTTGACSNTLTCQGSTFGNCCSQYGYCGSTAAYCGAGCNPAGGSCT